MQREYEKGYATVLLTVPVREPIGGLNGFPIAKIMLAQGCFGLSKSEEAEPLEAIELIDRTGHCMREAEAHRVLGEVLRARGDIKNGATAFAKAIEIAKSQQAKSRELRIAISCAKFV